MTKNAVMEPWARGPFELIRHANEHLAAGGDTDRRIALIGFDNAIEVCIDVFLKLHPRLRDGLELEKEEVDKALRNYHTKIEFLDSYIALKNLALTVSIEAIVWFHSLRNELYHSGNGMVPELHVLEGSRDAAVSVFNALFKTDISSTLGDKPPTATTQTAQIPFVAQNDEMEFLRVYIEFERTLEHALDTMVGRIEVSRPRTIREMWEEYRTRANVPSAWDAVVQRALPLRNRIAHGKTLDTDSEGIIGVALELWDITDAIRASGHHQEDMKTANISSVKGMS